VLITDARVNPPHNYLISYNKCQKVVIINTRIGPAHKRKFSVTAVEFLISDLLVLLHTNEQLAVLVVSSISTTVTLIQFNTNLQNRLSFRNPQYEQHQIA